MTIDRRRFVLTSGAAIVATIGTPLSAASGDAMYGLIGKIIAKPGQRDALVAVLLAGTRGMPGCVSYVIAHDAKEPDIVWITEVWDNASSHEASLSLPQVRDALGKGRPLIAGFESQAVTVPIGGQGVTTG